MAKPLRYGAVVAALLAAPAALAETVEGVVKVAGGGLNAEVMVAASGNTGPVLCGMSDMTKQVKHLAAMTVKVDGEWKTNKEGQKTCFSPAAFTVTKMSTGRDAVVGKLTQKDGKYLVTTDDGKVQTLEDVSPGLKKLEGQKVILDLKQVDAPKGQDAASKVVTYAAFPQ